MPSHEGERNGATGRPGPVPVIVDVMSQPATPAAPAAPTAPTIDEQPAQELAPDPVANRARPWRCVVHDDPVNLMTYVTWVFRTYFGYPETKARSLMLQVHERGRAVVSSGGHEAVEADATAMHGFGLWATIEEEN